MKPYCDEIIRRFPEIDDDTLDEFDANSPTMLMTYVVSWLKSLGPDGITPDIERRVVSLARWCEAQPSGETAKDDLYTKFVVSFFEHLFDSDVTRPLIPKIYDYDHIISNADYLKQWVGETEYELALTEFKDHSRRGSGKRRKRLGSRKRR